MKLPIDNLGYPVRLQIGECFGSGFIISHNNKLYLITAKHVIFDPQIILLENSSLRNQNMKMMVYPLDNGNISIKPNILDIDLKSSIALGFLKAHEIADIVVIKLSKELGEEKERVSNVEYLESVNTIQKSTGSIVHCSMNLSKRFQDVEVTNDVFILGYPVDLYIPDMNQIDYNYPLVRKGIVAGKNHQNKTIILDVPVYGGNSGGIVLELNQSDQRFDIHLIGVIIQFVPWVRDKETDLHINSLQNSGYSIALPVDYIYDLIELIK